MTDQPPHSGELEDLDIWDELDDEWAVRISNIPTEEKGGPGSGFRGHAGRPGKVGGSLPEGIVYTPQDGDRILYEDKPYVVLATSKMRNAMYVYPLGKTADDGFEIPLDSPVEPYKGQPIHLHGPQANMEKIKEAEEEYLDAVDGNALEANNWTRKTWKAELQRITNEFVDDQRQFVRVPEEVLYEILYDERLKSQFESGKSGGWYEPSYRSQEELRLFGIPEDVDPTERPIYGYLMDNDTGYSERGPNVSQYGDAILRLKPEVRDRSTFCFSDSLGGEHYPSPMAKPSFTSILNDDFGNPLFEDSTSKFEDDYVETQVHGGVKISDIDQIAVRAVNKRVADALRKYGIKIVDYNGNDWPQYRGGDGLSAPAGKKE